LVGSLVRPGGDDQVSLVVEVGGDNFQVFSLVVFGECGVDAVNYKAWVGPFVDWEAMGGELDHHSGGLE
jgi:hypothetical protein